MITDESRLKWHDTDTLKLSADHSKMIVTIKADGSVQLGENVSLDEASRAFWAAVQSLTKQSPAAPMPLELADALCAERQEALYFASLADESNKELARLVRWHGGNTYRQIPGQACDECRARAGRIWDKYQERLVAAPAPSPTPE